MTGANRPVAIISGAASGIGRATAVRLARRGDRVVIGHYAGDPHDPHETLRLVTEAGGEGLIVGLDVSSTASVSDFVEAGLSAFGRIDHVVANAGILRRAPFEAMTDAEWDDVLAVDLHGVMRLARAACPHLMRGASIVAISSIAGGVYGWQEHVHYATAKAGVIGMMRSLAVELGPIGVRANVVIPGLIETPQSLDAQNSLGPEGLSRAGDYIPWGRVGTADEVARVIEFLTSEQAEYVTGQSITVDGGLTVAMRD
ncbi:SDR family NAD(P)-dependent oxidoreductase [Agreia sp. COWG]|uniref:SDR family NAD(P)-dependent oxidoreductase n=1 Tax=Agreia sp. COWG TaxID=2773266 RepID=UPI001927A080|nr:SDR family oxidoreductase [Agreia sp. COWG]CAD6005204.1 3-oxoacyl-[acyl-carrier-protein] reductase FabG [Agreia sp. COWG]